MATTTEFIAAIELSSSKILGIAGRRGTDGSLQVLAYAAQEAPASVRKGIVFNIDDTAEALTQVIRTLEGKLGASIARVYAGIGGLSLRTVRNAVGRQVETADGIITQELVDALCDENLSIPMEDMDILDVAPQEYLIDNTAQTRAIGVAGGYITAQFLNIVARTSLKKNLELSFEKAHIEIADLLIAPTALAGVVLTETEMRSGCALIDLGADTTTVAVYKNNILRFLSVIPLGGSSITHDIATLQMEESEAEQLKRHYGDARYEEANSDVPASCSTEDGRAIPLLLLNDIVDARIEEILANAWNQIQLSGYDDRLLSGVVLTGGGANLTHIEEAFRKRSKQQKVRIARFVHPVVTGMIEELKKDGTHNTLLGLLYAGRENCRKEEEETPIGGMETPAALPSESSQSPQPTDFGNLFGDDIDYRQQGEEALKGRGKSKGKGKPEEKAKKPKKKGWLDNFREKITGMTDGVGDLFGDDEINQNSK
ncbi:MAG: cell division protein FtsA [Prevotellaceae bacterium]|jgi:cell division protein FtsA|nr:cell division protein FtsA [Prevotellaceae bacterium]